MAEFLANAYEGLEIWRVGIEELREQDLNAQCMPPDMLERLTLNISKEKRLESLPFVIRTGKGKYQIISGHHRYRAARNAGLKEIVVLVETRPLDRSRVVSKQIAHNTLVGQTDKDILRRLCEEITRTEDLLEAYVNKETLGIDLKPVQVDDIIIKYDWQLLVLAFLPSQLKDLEALVERIPPKTNTVGVVSMDIFEDFGKTLLALSKAEKVKNLGAAISRMVEITNEYLTQKEAEGVKAAS